jgi:hypothetical protein
VPNSKGQPTVYVSSTFIDLEGHRAALKIALEKVRYDVDCMEKYTAFDQRPLDRCLADVAAADVYVLLIAHRYGYRPPENNPQRRSITQLEYEQASSHGKPRLVFTVDRKKEWLPDWIDSGDDAIDLAAFRAEVETKHGVERFTTPDQLASLVLQALQALRPPSMEAASPPAPTYTPAQLQSWVERHQPQLSAAFRGLPSVQARQVHVPLEVCLIPAGAADTEGPRLLQPEDMQPLLGSAGSQVLLLSGDGGAGKTSLAFEIARWWLEGKPGGMVRLPVDRNRPRPAGEAGGSGAELVAQPARQCHGAGAGAGTGGGPAGGQAADPDRGSPLGAHARRPRAAVGGPAGGFGAGHQPQ